MRTPLSLLTAALLGVALAVTLGACGSSGKGLIPTANAGPLQSDFEAVAQAAQNGNGDCTATTEAINKTERDFAALPVSVNAGLHGRLSEGISNLRERALALCAQPLAQTTTTSSSSIRATRTTSAPTPRSQQSTPTQTAPTNSPSTATTPTNSPPTATTPANSGGGTAAPGDEGPSAGPGGGTGIGSEAGEDQGRGQEGGK